jgi:hypothetical protein
MMLHSSRVVLLAALAILAAPIAVRTARADNTAEARQHYQKGKQLFDSGDYRGAMAEFATADKLAPSPLLEFNIALCHERLGEKSEAVRRYRLYLDRVPNAQNRTEVEQKIRDLEADVKKESAPPPPPPPAEAAPSPPAAEAAPPPAEAGPPTGDQDLERANRIDIGKIRAQREAAGDEGGGGAAATAPAEGEASASAPPPAEGGKKESRPIYKQWWFWVVAGVSAVILIDIATSGSDDGDSAASRLMPSPGARSSDGAGGGAVLWRF